MFLFHSHVLTMLWKATRSHQGQIPEPECIYGLWELITFQFNPMEPLGLYLIQYYFSGSCMLNNRILRPPYSTTTTSLPHLKLKFSGDATNTYTLTLSLNCGVTVGNVLACQDCFWVQSLAGFQHGHICYIIHRIINCWGILRSLEQQEKYVLKNWSIL